MNNQYKKPGIIGVIVLFVALTLLLFFMTNTSGEEAENLLDDLEIYSNSKGKVQDYMLVSTLQNEIDGKFQEVEEEIVEMTSTVTNLGELPIPGNLRYKSTGNAIYDAVNVEAYKISLRAVSYKELDWVPDNYKDPLLIMAQAITEYHTAVDFKKTFAPFLPSRYMPNTQINVETLRTYSVNTAMKLPELMKSDLTSRATYQGPLQFNKGYGLDIPDSRSFRQDVIYKSELDNLSRDSAARSKYHSKYGAGYVRVSDGALKAGDRFNWNDISIIGWQKWMSDMKNIKDSRMEDNVKTTAALGAYLAMNHNIGQSVSTERMSNPRSNLCSGCTNKEVWQYVNAYNSPELNSALEDVAKQKVSGIKANNGIGHLKSEEAIAIANSVSDKHPIMKRVNLKGEKALHAMKFVTWYYVLRELYYNGDTEVAKL